ncbi:MAG: 1-acyl-sn-glycerol-3-phosphate acyltransferase, partial [Chloroflexi bacterium]
MQSPLVSVAQVGPRGYHKGRSTRSHHKGHIMIDRRTRIIRRIFRLLGWLVVRTLTRTTITGREHLNTAGPVIFASNHTSTFDALLVITLLPTDTTFIGPGDFRLLWPANLVVKYAGLILMKRGSVDREGLKRMLDTLKGGGRLALFPDGGTWEKPIWDVKSGANYLSHATGARIVPMGFGGTYQIWMRILRLQFPRVTVRIGAPLPPTTVSEDRKRRPDDLQDAAVDLMRRIYDLLPPDTQAHYDRQARLEFSGALRFRPDDRPAPDVPFAALAELVSKPNLFSPLYLNARLPVRPFVRAGRYVPAQQMKRAADALLAAFSAGDFAGYLEYRLGETKAAEIRTALAAISAA